eukprot:m.168737 g.168737  ORF g.168737 m.168737 type:complete len:301 (+) comp14483_c1_seq4:191-1093(+)
MLKLTLGVAVFALVSLMSTAVYGWGAIGHQTVAEVAQRMVSNTTNGMVTQLLQGNSMANVSTWADDVRSQPQWEWTFPLHFINTPDQLCSYEYTRDCNFNGVKDFCVAGAIMNYTNQLVQYVKKPSSLPIEQVRDALKFVIHFVGDIHQPLHTGFHFDQGGNLDKVTFFGKATNLHSCWDTYIIERMLSQTYGTEAKWQAFLADAIKNGEYAKEAAGWAKCSDATSGSCINAIAVDGIHYACKNAYECVPNGDEPCPVEKVIANPKLDETYYNQAVPIVNLRIAQGAVRLAAFLDGVFGS